MMEVMIICLAISSISLTLSKSYIGKILVAWAFKRSEIFGELMSCHYCLAHWLALIFYAVYQPSLIEGYFIVDAIISIFAMITIATIISCIITTLMNLTNYLGNK